MVFSKTLNVFVVMLLLGLAISFTLSFLMLDSSNTIGPVGLMVHALQPELATEHPSILGLSQSWQPSMSLSK